MDTEIGRIAQSLKGKNSRVRRPVPKESGKVTWGAYIRAGAGTVKDTVFRFLGLNVGTPLQRKLSQLALALFGVAVLFAIVVLAANKFTSNSDVIIYAVATGLSMIPASLVVVLTITMSMGTCYNSVSLGELVSQWLANLQVRSEWFKGTSSSET